MRSKAIGSHRPSPRRTKFLQVQNYDATHEVSWNSFFKPVPADYTLVIFRYHDNQGIYNIPIWPTVGNFLILSVSVPSIVLHRIQSALFLII